MDGFSQDVDGEAVPACGAYDRIYKSNGTGVGPWIDLIRGLTADGTWNLCHPPFHFIRACHSCSDVAGPTSSLCGNPLAK